MGKDYEKVKKTAHEVLDIVIPRLAEEYDLELHKPGLSVSIMDYMSEAGLFIPVGDYGLIKLQEESCSNKLTCCAVASHEMGHAGVYQNSPFYPELYKENQDFHILEEGISEKFIKTGLKILKDEKYISNSDFYLQSLNISVCGNLKEFFFPDKYIIGEMIVNYYSKRGIRIKDIIMRPEEFEEDLKKNWKKMVKPHSMPSIKFWEAITKALL